VLIEPFDGQLLRLFVRGEVNAVVGDIRDDYEVLNTVETLVRFERVILIVESLLSKLAG
jgi:hypothetical protein